MRVLQLCLKPPKPSVDGGCIAINTISEGLINEQVAITILTLSTHKHPFDISYYTDEFIQKTKIKAVFVDTKMSVVDAFSNIVTSDSYNISRFFSTDFDILLRKTLHENEFDIVHLESLFMTTYCHTIRRFSQAKIVLRSHNLEHMIWEKMALKATNLLKKSYLKLLAKQLKTYEVSILQDIDGIAAITKEDAQKYIDFGYKKPISIIPFGLNINDAAYNFNIQTKVIPSNCSCFHLGAMDWKPNLEGVHWFLNDVWTAIVKKYPAIELHLGGRKMPANFLDKLDNPHNVFNHGEIDSALDFIQKNDIMIVPVLSAGGMRVKIIEGMALGKVVISTTIGAEGIACEDKKNILIADNAAQFVQQLDWLFEDESRFLSVQREALKLVQLHYDNKKIVKNLVQFYNQLCN